MPSNTSTIKTTSSALDAANDFASHLGSAAGNVLGATKDAGKQIGSVAADEMAVLKADLDDLIARIPSLSDIDLTAAKENLLRKISETKNSAVRASSEQLEACSEVASNYLREKPLQTVAAVAGIGLVIGFLLAKK